MTRLIMIAMTAVSVSSRFTSCKGNDLETYIHNRDSHYEFLETHAEKSCSGMSKATSLISACKDTPWLQVTCTLALTATAIIGRCEATKNHIITHVPANTITVHSVDSIGKVAKNILEMSKSNGDAHVSDISNNDLL